MWSETDSPSAADGTAIGSAIKGAVEPMPHEARSALRGRLTAMVESQRVPWFVSAHRWVAAALVASSVLGGTSYAAACSRPGDPLYPIRKTVENTWSKVTGQPQPTDPAPVEQDDTRGASEVAPRTSPAAEERAAIIAPKTDTGDASGVDAEPGPAGASRPAPKSSARRPEQQEAAGQRASDAGEDEDDSRTEPDEPSVDTEGPEQPDADQEPSDDDDAGQVDGDDDHNDESSDEQPPLSPDEDDDPEEE